METASNACREQLNKYNYYHTVFTIPAGAKCIFWGNGFRYTRPASSVDIFHHAKVYEYARSNIGESSCKTNNTDQPNQDSYGLYRVKDMLEGTTCAYKVEI